MQLSDNNLPRAGRAAALVTLASGLLLAPGVGLAVELPRYDYQGAAAVCQPARPEFEAGLRSRPLGLTNVSDETVYVTCAVQGTDPAGTRGAYQVLVNVSNNAPSSSATVSCTLVVVFRVAGEASDRTAYLTKSLDNLPAGTGGFISWVPTDLTGQLGGPDIPKSGISCALPTQATLQYTGNYYREDVGS